MGFGPMTHEVNMKFIDKTTVSGPFGAEAVYKLGADVKIAYFKTSEASLGTAGQTLVLDIFQCVAYERDPVELNTLLWSPEYKIALKVITNPETDVPPAISSITGLKKFIAQEYVLPASVVL